MWNTGAGVANGGGAGSLAGTKRRADDSIGDSERFTKRFNLLNLEGNKGGINSNYYIPISKPPTSPTAPITASSSTVNNAPARTDDELMQVDDTRDRVYIHDLDEELADIESDEEKLIFLPDIDKKLSRISQQLLQSRRDEDHEGQELVLYSVPKSLTVDEGHDSVRKAIIESRQRAREKAEEEARHHDMNCKYDQSDHAEAVAETAHGYSTGYVVEEDDDPDVMDMD
ncbi:hypothetical protein M409DRAFT_56790 [Zasmidium cellare ATCC 36951]|uniref:Uncharacterized protein n=1 Tax=Zasmidium cellare ATCC 36951 TaxID=1080233 RepID=A0A6A6CD08_ZASCE|nr:uncharacterized protein M409DRAFT_56790 [Zasmidium cellare ATCC 36951]KAF2164068.1 hypothetical protein M409DRAFT_56790 [Zasmidium cellare ATCC 36951]